MTSISNIEKTDTPLSDDSSVFDQHVDNVRQKIDEDGQNEPPRDATDNEVWPEPLDTMVRADGDALVYQSNDGKSVRVQKDVNPELYAFLERLDKFNQSPDTRQNIVDTLQKEDGARLLSRDEDMPELKDVQFASFEGDVAVVKTFDGKTIVVANQLAPDSFSRAADMARTLSDINLSEKEGYKLADSTFYPDDEMISVFGMADELENGLIRFETPDGDKYIVSKDLNKPLYDRVVEKADAWQEGDVDSIRNNYDLPSSSDLNVLEVKTDVDVDSEKPEDGKLSVSELATKSLIEKYQKGIDKGSIAKDDPRAKLVRAFEAKGAFENGRGITGYEEAKRPFGKTWRESDDKQTLLTSDDMHDIIDGNALDTSLEELFSNETISKDYSDSLNDALGRIDRDGLEKKLDDLVFGKDSKYMEYISDLKESGYTHAAQSDIAQVLQSLSILNPEKAQKAAAQLQTDALTMDLNGFISDPGKVSDDNKSQAMKDLFGLLKSIFKQETLDLPRRTIETIDKFINGVINGKTDEKSVLKAVQEAAAEAGKNGGHLSKEGLEKYSAYVPLSDREGFAGFMGKLNSMGILGSMGGGISLISGIYQLAGKGGQLADTPLERLAVAKDFISFVGATQHFATLGDSIIKTLGGNTKMVDILGLKTSVPDIWGKDGLWGKKIEESIPTNSYQLPEIEQEDWNKWTADTSAALDEAAEKVAKGNPPTSSLGDISTTAVDGVQATLESQAEAAGIKNTSGLKNVGKTVLRVLSPVADTFGGIADVVLGAFTIKDGIKNGSDLGKAAGSLQVIGGAASLTAGGIGLAGAFGVGGAALGAAAAPLFLVGVAVLGIAGIIGFFVEHEKKQKLTNGEGQWYKDLAADGLLQSDWAEKVEYARYSIHKYDGRDAPDNESLFEYQKREWEHFKETPQDGGSSSNRLDKDMHIDKSMADYRRDYYDSHHDVIDRIISYWDDWNGRDSIVSDKDLRKISSDENRSTEEREAAQFLLDDNGFFDMLDTLAKGGSTDGKVSTGDLDRWRKGVEV